jgi:hypothetical protein
MASGALRLPGMDRVAVIVASRARGWRSAMKRGNPGAVRLLSLLILVVFTLGGLRPAWSCPSQAAEPSCCCEPEEQESPPEDVRLAPVCCCEAKPASESSTSAPRVAAPGSERVVRELAPPLAITIALPPPLVLVESLPPTDLGPERGPPRTLLHLGTLLLC